MSDYEKIGICVTHSYFRCSTFHCRHQKLFNVAHISLRWRQDLHDPAQSIKEMRDKVERPWQGFGSQDFNQKAESRKNILRSSKA